MRKFVLAFFIAVLIPAVALASEVRQMPYAYSFECVNSPAGSAFVICNNCPARKALVRAPKPIPIAIMMSDPRRAALGQLGPGPVNPATARPASPVSVKPAPPKPASWTGPLSVHFAFDSYALRPTAKAKLKTIPSMLKGPVSVIGYTDDIGTKAYNIGLSLKRARAVADYLKRLGVAQVAVIGKGECCPVSKLKKLNRRVEIKEAQ